MSALANSPSTSRSDALETTTKIPLVAKMRPSCGFKEFEGKSYLSTMTLR